MPHKKLSIQEQLERHSIKNANEKDCWLWNGSLKYTGYGELGINRKTKYAHRVSYEFYKGEIPKGMFIHHICHIRHCVNPSHLELVTPAENMIDKLPRYIPFIKEKREKPTVEERFWEKVFIDPATKCWLWKGAKAWGYGKFGVKSDGKKKAVMAHRFSYNLHKGTIPEGLDLDHLCRVRNCVNPDHLEPVIRRENVRRGISLWGQNMNKTHCPLGHPYSGENLYVYNNCRYCLICRRMHSSKKKPKAESLC